MGLLDLFKRKPKAGPAKGAQSPARPIDVELLRRLERISAVSAHVHGGQDPEQISLAIHLDDAGNIDADRPAMGFRVDVERVGPDQWRLAAGIDDAVASCRFWMDLEVPEVPALDPATFDMNQLPALPLRISKPPDHVRNPLARSVEVQPGGPALLARLRRLHQRGGGLSAP
ncbi:hypothetical protein JY651_15155 [Pyxidicoccus parkwayensis]|uniref:Uncharacterized protein n=1 Tax=Pyxidicoccus parkwayensis TaxID=2813578 RepID=A0ABX7P6Q7_9BACT|nr:hypothetical protein [Pyxidicoccus parkwaysis]QSQ26184.1 hypothetical protein JY651_15155 [Pyxidicoccus parkwaysis]